MRVGGRSHRADVIKAAVEILVWDGNLLDLNIKNIAPD